MARLRHHLLGREALTPRVCRIRLADVLGVLEEQVGAERHRIACRTTQQIHDRGAGQLTLQIEHGHFKSTDDLGHIFGHMGAGGQRNLFTQKLGTGFGGSYQRGHAALHGVQAPRRQTLQGRCGLGQRLQHGQIAIGLVDAHAPTSGFDLNDRTQSPRLVNTCRIEQWRITERNGRDAHVADGKRRHEITGPGSSKKGLGSAVFCYIGIKRFM